MRIGGGFAYVGIHKCREFVGGEDPSNLIFDFVVCDGIRSGVVEKVVVTCLWRTDARCVRISSGAELDCCPVRWNLDTSIVYMLVPLTEV